MKTGVYSRPPPLTLWFSIVMPLYCLRRKSWPIRSQAQQSLLSLAHQSFPNWLTICRLACRTYVNVTPFVLRGWKHRLKGLSRYHNRPNNYTIMNHDKVRKVEIVPIRIRGMFNCINKIFAQSLAELQQSQLKFAFRTCRDIATLQ